MLKATQAFKTRSVSPPQQRAEVNTSSAKDLLSLVARKITLQPITSVASQTASRNKPERRCSCG